MVPHQILEDIGLMKNVTGMTVITPVITTKPKHTLALADHHGPAY
jgi:transketolase C-terminal domain/subunit